MIVYAQSPKKLMKKFLKLISKFTKFQSKVLFLKDQFYFYVPEQLENTFSFHFNITSK